MKPAQALEDFPVAYLLGLFLVAVTLVYLFVYSNTVENVDDKLKLINASLTFILMIVIPFVFYFLFSQAEKRKIPLPFGSGKNIGVLSAVAFLIGAGVWTLLSASKNFAVSSFAIYSPQFSVFSSAASVFTDPFWASFIVNVAAPFAEETFFLIGIPVAIFFFFSQIGKETGAGFLANKWLGIFVSIIVSSLIFAFFHSQATTEFDFVIAAMIFRGILIFFVWGDFMYDIVPKLQVGIMLAVGAHIANNVMFNGGWAVFTNAMLSGLWQGGIVVLLFFAYNFLMLIKIPNLLKSRG